ncbi:MAG TPA: NAD(P)/FAD-dependent oxidoreductase [Pyrinomonadaceae bacterium]|nr:NAD(P)/FAD-dependent oxidoreductase [Pyrinomonadaceae bacterium]
MTYDVAVVGAGVGGLTTAALLAARGLRVCVVEREPQAGGCATMSCESFGYSFEPGAGLYAAWQAGGLHERVFAELPVDAPEVRAVSPAYVVRLPDGADVRVGGSAGEFAETLREAFPECADEAVRFYRELTAVADALRRAARREPALATLSKLGRMRLAASEPRIASRVFSAEKVTAAASLKRVSTRFRRFIDAQLQLSAQCASDRCAYLYAALALTEPLRGMHALVGGASALVGRLVESIEKSGGTVRFGATALRLEYDAQGRAVGVRLLSGERIEATRAVISNLTVWDTYGKLVGLERTPAEMRARLKQLAGWGAYLLYAGADEDAVERLPAANLLVLSDWQEGAAFDAEAALLMFSAADAADARAPSGKRAVTVSTFTEAERWFVFHEDETEHEGQDEETLAAVWARLHAALPELGAGIEVIETATPRTFYERTRRKLGMVGGVGQSLAVFGRNAVTHRTSVPNLYMVGDTVFPGQGVAGVTLSAVIVANEIAPPV